jgi:preprotein translocase SecE subunit
MFKKTKQFVDEVINVISEITWPTKETLIQLTIVVLLVTVAIGSLLGAADFLFTKLISWFTLIN